MGFIGSSECIELLSVPLVLCVPRAPAGCIVETSAGVVGTGKSQSSAQDNDVVLSPWETSSISSCSTRGPGVMTPCTEIWDSYVNLA
ncbi:hypothetical protein C8T65DRAFT_688797 [Cerioporus squamosus]|nr:hypothetical protein C8T65DRAFT_688797 [Cerioporus squamosus]